MIYLYLALALIVVFGVIIYNGLIKLRNKCSEGWADIDTQLKRRQDLIPNLVETVKGYSSHEASTLENITKARAAAINAQTVEEKGQAENMLTGALKSIFALAENYPDLKANQNFLDLQQNLSKIEEEIQMSRRYYNGTVRDFNTKLQVFPNNIFAKFLNFNANEFFQASEEEKKNVNIDFSPSVDKAPEAPKEEAPPAPTPEASPPEEAPKPEEAPPAPTPEASPPEEAPKPEEEPPAPTPQA